MTLESAWTKKSRQAVGTSTGPPRAGADARQRLLGMQRAVGNQALAQSLQRRQDPALAQRPLPPTPPEILDSAVEKGMEAIREATRVAAAKYIVDHIVGRTVAFGKGRYGSSKNASVLASLELARNAARSLAWATTREEAKDGGHQRAVEQPKELAKSLEATYLSDALEKAAAKVLLDRPQDFMVQWHEAATTLEKLVRQGMDRRKNAKISELVASADHVVQAKVPEISRKTVAAVLATLDGKKAKPYRDMLKQKVAALAGAELMGAVLEESGPNRKQSSYTKHALAEEFEVKGGLGRITSVLSAALGKVVTSNGDSTKVDLLLKVPLSHGAFAGLRIRGEASKNLDRFSVLGRFSFVVGGEVPLVFRALLEVGGHVSGMSEQGVAGALEVISYSIYRTLRQSNVVHHSVTNALWGAGAKTQKKGETEAEAKYREAEEWAAKTEEALGERDTGLIGLFVGAGAKVGAKGIAHGEVEGLVGRYSSYTKRGIEAARKAGKGTRPALGGAQSSVAEQVTALEIGGEAGVGAFGGIDARGRLLVRDSSALSVKHGGGPRILEAEIEAGGSVTVPSVGWANELDWAAQALVSAVGAAATVANKIRQRSDDSTGSIAAATAISATLATVTQPNLKGILESAVLGSSKPGSGPSPLTSKTSVAGGVHYQPTSGGGGKIGAWVSLGGANDVKFDSPFAEFSAKYAKSWLYYDIVRKKLEVNGTPLWQAQP